MNQSRKRWTIGLGIGAGALLLLFIFFTATVNVYTDWLWFDSVGQLGAYTTRLWTQVATWAGGFLIAAFALVLNWILIPSSAFERIQVNVRGEKVKIGTRALKVILSIGAGLIALIMAAEARSQWMNVLRFIHATPFNLSDPLFGQDAGFYIFKLPLYQALTGWLLGLIIVSAIGSFFVYLISGKIRLQLAVTHLSVLGALFLLDKGVQYQLDRFGMLTSSRGLVFGAGYTDVHARIPLLTVLTVIVVLGAVALIVNSFIRRWRFTLIVAGVWIAVGILGPIYPALVQRFTVEPNELALERPYIEHNIGLTRHAYELDEIAESDYSISEDLTQQKLEENQSIINNVRIWDWRPLRTTYEQLQEIRTYYVFSDVDIDRYTIDGDYREVSLAVRELDSDQLREDARTWINQHLIYTHGYGLCLSPVSEATAEGLPNLLVRDIPPKSESPSLELTRPEIYFGEQTDNYIIVDTTEDEFDYPQGEQNAYTRYEGSAGVGLGNLIRRLAFALRFDSTSILLSPAITSDSRIIFHRSIQNRASTLTPMLWFDPDPYPVITDGRIVWLYDAYTWSNDFPYSEPNGGLNYLRNSVKATVDAYTGEVKLHVVDPSDPIIQTYQSIFPDLFIEEEMSEDLQAHWRYPEQMFRIQADVYGRYHMEDPRVFYNQEDLWERPNEVREGGETAMMPYYVIMKLPDKEEAEFMMIRPYVPAGKQNMIAWLYARSDGENYGQKGVYKFSKEALVYGPMQIEGRIDQNPTISQQLTLWNQRGSSVIRGNLIVIPLNGTLLYVEPIYLQAESGQLPQLARVIVAYGNETVMAEDLATGLLAVIGEAPTDGDGVTPTPEPTGVGELARSAQAHYEAAQECLSEGDWACYGAELDAMEQDLQALIAATEE